MGIWRKIIASSAFGLQGLAGHDRIAIGRMPPGREILTENIKSYEW